MGRKRYTRMDDPHAIFVNCFLCQRKVQCGPHRYEGRNVRKWDVWICDACRSGNWDGVVVSSPHGKRLIEHLQAKNIPYKLNGDGHLPIPG